MDRGSDQLLSQNNDSRGNQDSLRAKVCSSKTQFEQEQERLAIFVVEGSINIPALNGIFLSEKCTFGIKEHIKSYLCWECTAERYCG